MTETALKYTVKCKEIDCSNFYYARGLCKRHYKILLGREGGYAKEYVNRKKNPEYAKMKKESDKKYRQRLKELGILKEKQQQYYKKYSSNPKNISKIKKRHDEYYSKTKERRRELAIAFSRRHRDLLKYRVIAHYSNNEFKCKNCGIDVYSVLTIDHINNNGAEHKRSLSKTGKASSSKMYKDIIDKGFPLEYQVLCFNCNYHKEFMRRTDVV